MQTLFGTKRNKHSLASRKRRLDHRARLGVEPLENREMMAAYISAGALVIAGTAANDSARVYNHSSTQYRVNFNGVDQYFAKSAITTNTVRFYGYAGNDYFNNYVTTMRNIAYGGTGDDTLIGYNNIDYLYGEDGNDTLYGYGGNDYLYGGAGHDKLYGQDGNDFLYGGTGNDKLYGGNGNDCLYGEDGNDFMDAGTAAELANGGNGYDFNAFVVSVGGASYTDVFQGSSPTCWLVAAISSVSLSGTNLASRISYLGNDTYRVGMFGTSGAWTSIDVTFNGDLLAADARPNPSQEGESWVLLTQRAYLQSRGLSLTSPPAGNSYYPLEALTGRTSDWYGASHDSSDQTRIINALNTGHCVDALTYDGSPSCSLLVGDHFYTVVSYSYDWRWTGSSWQYQFCLMLRNPWGTDGGSGYGPNDGLVRIWWSDFQNCMEGYAVN
jgi:hypothetical protein